VVLYAAKENFTNLLFYAFYTFYLVILKIFIKNLPTATSDFYVWSCETNKGKNLTKRMPTTSSSKKNYQVISTKLTHYSYEPRIIEQTKEQRRTETTMNGERNNYDEQKKSNNNQFLGNFYKILFLIVFISSMATKFSIMSTDTLNYGVKPKWILKFLLSNKNYHILLSNKKLRDRRGIEYWVFVCLKMKGGREEWTEFLFYWKKLS
jgi:ATP-dependent Zn protease